MQTTHSAVRSPNYSRSPSTGHRVNRRGGRIRRGNVAVVRRTVVAPARAPGARRGGEIVTRRLLVAIRVAMGLLFLACGVQSVLGSALGHGVHVQQGALAFGGALLLTGALLPLLKGSEVLFETVLDLQRALGARRAGEV